MAATWGTEEHKCLSRELCAPVLRGSGKWSLRQRFLAGARNLGEQQGKLCLMFVLPGPGHSQDEPSVRTAGRKFPD